MAACAAIPSVVALCLPPLTRQASWYHNNPIMDTWKIEKTVRKGPLSILQNQDAEDLAYWLSQPPEKRIEAVEYLRWLRHGDALRFQQIARVVKRIQR